MKRLLMMTAAIALIATTADAQSWRDGQGRGEGRGQWRQQQQQQAAPQQQAQSSDQGRGGRRGGDGSGRRDRGAQQQQQPQVQQAQPTQQSFRAEGSGRRGGDRQYDRRNDGQRDGGQWSGQWSGQSRGGYAQGNAWSSNDRGRSQYRGGYQSQRGSSWRAPQRYRAYAWRAPRGYAYSRFSYGMILPSAFWATDYVLRDYWNYGLPQPPPGLRWIRVGSDALLVDRSGYVVEAAYDLFWG